MFLQKLSARIISILLVFFLVALIAIGLTLSLSWQLEGSAAAINDAGSQRMRTYRIAYLLSRQPISDDEGIALRRNISDEVATFDRVMADLENGDPKRPLFLPREIAIERLVRQMRQEWNVNMKPQIEQLLDVAKDTERTAQMVRFHASIENFMTDMNRLVLAVEISSASSTNLLRLLQIGLIVLAMIGTSILIGFFFVMVIRPLEEMRGGIKRMGEADFSVRLRVRRADEFGELGEGFNRMADRLEDLYGTLEQRVEEKTRDIENKHRELTLLYEVAAYLSEPVARDLACREVLDKAMLLLGADAGLVRFVDVRGGQLRIGVHRNLSEEFVRRQAGGPVGECLCGGAALGGRAVSCELDRSGTSLMPSRCSGEGFASMVAIPISSKNKTLGIFSLFFFNARMLSATETRLLEAVGQHLGVAIENQRLVEREKEMAVSEERNLLAAELHDSIAQSLAFLNIQSQMLQDSLRREDMTEAQDELARIREGIQESYDDVRELLVHFRIRVVDCDVNTAVASAVEKFEEQTGIATELIRRDEDGEMPTQNTIQILHIVQEALSNVRKHAAATRVRVTIEQGSRRAIVVHDNGRGFDPRVAELSRDTHVGVSIMRERAHRIGGRFDIQSRVGEGTTVTLILPHDTD